jgi:hypothetical protein
LRSLQPRHDFAVPDGKKFAVQFDPVRMNTLARAFPIQLRGSESLFGCWVWNAFPACGIVELGKFREFVAAAVAY